MEEELKRRLFKAAAGKLVAEFEEILKTVKKAGKTHDQIFFKKDENKNTPVHYLLSRGCFCEECELNGEKCLDILLDCEGRSQLANCENGSRKTPMHLVLENRIPLRMVRALVRNGASITGEDGIKDKELARRLINEYPEVMEIIFDNGIALIETQQPGIYDIHLDWRCLVYSKNIFLDPAPGGLLCTNSVALEERWQESKFLHEIVRNQNWEIERLLLKHPLVQAFTHYSEPKSFWKVMYNMFLMLALIFHISFVMVFYLYFCTWNGTEYCDVKDEDWALSTGLASCSALFSIWSVTLELRKMYVFGLRHYLTRLWPGLIVLANGLLIWVTVWSVILQLRYSKILWQHNWAAISAIFCSITFMGQLSTTIRIVGRYMQMLIKVSERILTTMVIMAPVYYGFLLAFRILITDSRITWFKLVTMIVNGAEYEDLLDNDRGKLYEGFSYAVLAAFIIVMIIVVLNFLVGIAVSDVQELTELAETKNMSNQITARYLLDCILPSRVNKSRYWKHDSELKRFGYVSEPYVCNIGTLNDEHNTSSLPKTIRFELINAARRNCKSATVLPPGNGRGKMAVKSLEASRYPYHQQGLPTNWSNNRINTNSYQVQRHD